MLVKVSTLVILVKSASITVDAATMLRVSAPSPPETVSALVKPASVNESVSLPAPPVMLSPWSEIEPVKVSPPAPPVMVIMPLVSSTALAVKV